MAVALPFIAAAGTLASTGLAVKGAVDAGNARDEAEKAKKEQEAEAGRLAQEAKDKEIKDAEREKAIRGRESARGLQRVRAASSQGRSGTLLTGPTGLQGTGDAPIKTLLGS